MKNEANHHTEDDLGSGTVAMVGVLLVALVIIAMLPFVISIHTAAVKSQAVADLAALAGADQAAVNAWTPSADIACEYARQVAETNGAKLMRCQCQDTDVYVEVSHHVAAVVGTLSPISEVRSVARAGLAQPENVAGQ